MLRRLVMPFMLLALVLAGVACSREEDREGRFGPIPTGGSVLGIRSSAFEDNGAIPAKYTCDGENLSPPITIDPVPAGTVMLALIVTDIDGPGGDFVHWTVFNMAAGSDIAEGTVPLAGTLGVTGRGSAGYFGPCPLSGEHRYVFDVYALDASLTLGAEQATKAALLTAMEGHILQQSTLTGVYSRTPTTSAP